MEAKARVCRLDAKGRGVRKKQSTQKGSFQPLGLVVILFVFALGSGYLFSVNQNAVQGFKLRALEKQIASLEDENAQLQIDEADTRSLYKLKQAVENTSMRNIDELTVINGNQSVALR